jgi:TctA family transporter
VDYVLLVLVLDFSLLGGCLGIVSGLVPGIHVNTLALLLLASYPLIASALDELCALICVDHTIVPLLVATIIVSASVVHSFVDFIPSIFLGAPGDSEALSVLPGHRLLMAGQGLDAVRCAAEGSLLGALFGVLLALPLHLVMGPPLDLESKLSIIIPFALLVVAIVLVLSERERGGLEVAIDARHGTAQPSPFLISIVNPVPINLDPVMLTGTIVRQGRFSILETERGAFRIILPRRRSITGFASVRGTWRVRRSRWHSKILAAEVMGLSGVLGFIALNARLPFSDVFQGMGQSILFPLLTGLFGLPTLLLSLAPGSIPKQEDEKEARTDLLSGTKGALAGLLAGWFPGITSTAATVMATMIGRGRHRRESQEDGAKRFIVMVSSVGTASAVFSLIALAVVGKGRTGAMLAVKSVLGAEGVDALGSLPSYSFALLLLSVLIGSAFGYYVTLFLGRFMARRLGGKDTRRLTKIILVFVVGLVIVFNGIPGLILLACSTLLGLVPPTTGIGRVHLTGCLLVPLILLFFGLQQPILGALGS